MNDISASEDARAGDGQRTPRGRRRAAGLLTALVGVLAAAACGASRTDVRTAPVASLSDAVECSVEEGEAMGFEVVGLDRDDHRVVLERTDESVGRSDPTFQRALDQLTVEPAGEDPRSARELSVEARTYHEFFNRRGRVRRQVNASEGVRAAAGTLLDRCLTSGRGGG